MTTERQKKAVRFCEEWLNISFQGDINNREQVSNFLSDYLDAAKAKLENVSYNTDIY